MSEELKKFLAEQKSKGDSAVKWLKDFMAEAKATGRTVDQVFARFKSISGQGESLLVLDENGNLRWFVDDDGEHHLDAEGHEILGVASGENYVP